MMMFGPGSHNRMRTHCFQHATSCPRMRPICRKTFLPGRRNKPISRSSAHPFPPKPSPACSRHWEKAFPHGCERSPKRGQTTVHFPHIMQKSSPSHELTSGNAVRTASHAQTVTLIKTRHFAKKLPFPSIQQILCPGQTGNRRPPWSQGTKKPYRQMPVRRISYSTRPRTRTRRQALSRQK